jgi:hypothetical protein
VRKQSRRNNRKSANQSRKSPTKKKLTLENLEVNKDVPIGVIPAMYGDKEGVRLANQVYEVVQPNGWVVPVTVTFEINSRISNLLTLLRTTTGNSKLFTNVDSTWPKKWHYLTEPQLQYIESIGIPVISRPQRLMDSLSIPLFPQWLYYGINVDEFFDSWLEVVWQEYIIEHELIRYNALPNHAKTARLHPHATIKENIVELKRAEAWISLENCSVRIRSIWDRIHKYLIPLYFRGELPSADKNYWIDLDKDIRNLLASKPELDLYDHIYDFITNDILGKGSKPKSLLKELRDNLTHNFSHRPDGIVPPKSSSGSGFPSSPDGFHQLILEEHDRTRELLVVIAAIMRAKSPPNPPLTTDL